MNELSDYCDDIRKGVGSRFKTRTSEKRSPLRGFFLALSEVFGQCNGQRLQRSTRMMEGGDDDFDEGASVERIGARESSHIENVLHLAVQGSSQS